jgi:tetratricopeptide (TPR) repeat protein
MIAALVCFLPPLAPVEAQLAAADALARSARAAPEADRARAVDAALEAYAALLRLRPKDIRLVPQVRRRRASLLRESGRPAEALREHEAILEGPARRRDRAQALRDAGKLLERGGDLHGAEARYRRAVEEYGDIVRVRAEACLARGRVLQAMMRPKEAEKAYLHVVEKCRDEAEAAVAAYDALAMLALAEGRPRDARTWLRRCMAQFGKKATRDDRYGRFVARLLADMKAPAALARGTASGGAGP